MGGVLPECLPAGAGSVVLAGGAHSGRGRGVAMTDRRFAAAVAFPAGAVLAFSAVFALVSGDVGSFVYGAVAAVVAFAIWVFA